ASLGRVAVVAVGAYNVGRISAAFDTAWNGAPGSVANQPGARVEVRRYQPPVPVAPGDEIMAFHLGSTVVLLLEPGSALDPALAPGQEVQVGQVLARAGRGA
ncbi:MAG TPA: phosphatidylserine decarboxylase, partial [Longimicrobiales bacterium]